ncbi:glycosyl hydrolase family 32 [Arthrobacter bambusae]|uniref:glycosyl hydrolase family 32 n=1 Tax=Arthrobacter bambusae TaxID=1338426 RepID=UPI001F50A4E9|nr:glycosyl hydrolase family 32 [Arthrobacter bambusae]MCI0139999.1 glycosyl hydrolase family 32 [Arthrobacter bambusae]
MTFAKNDHWVWDFWIADDGEAYHLYYLQAPKSLGHPELRHRNASIGHATSADLHTWRDHGTVLVHGGPSEPDASATWTGSVVRGDDGLWRMFYTGSRFLRPDAITNIETICVAVSRDLHTWHKSADFALNADPRGYETLDDSVWHEEAWRDPWVFQSASGSWHMVITARGRSGPDERNRGVIGYARSDDLENWSVGTALTGSAGFAHLEVPQIVGLSGSDWLLFSCDGSHLAGPRAGLPGGIWLAPAASPLGPFDLDQASLLADEHLYSGRIVHNRSGRPVLLAFENLSGTGDFVGRISDPRDVEWNGHGFVLAPELQERQAVK